MKTKKKKSPFAHSNVKLFVAFHLFFNSRFYYPVFSILFLDFGLSLSQFAVLNSVWAATIVICEVPSGALADTLGRRNLLVFSGTLMVLEMALLAFAPRGDADLLFLFFLANRILSGMAEASASGADEALAYDTLVREGDAGQWGTVLEKQMLVRSIGFIVSMIVGAAVYDPALMQKASDVFGFGMTFDKNATLRLPLYLTLALALCALGSTLLMKEVHPADCEEDRRMFETGRGRFQADIPGRAVDSGHPVRSGGDVDRPGFRLLQPHADHHGKSILSHHRDSRSHVRIHRFGAGGRGHFHSPDCQALGRETLPRFQRGGHGDGRIGGHGRPGHGMALVRPPTGDAGILQHVFQRFFRQLLPEPGNPLGPNAPPF